MTESRTWHPFREAMRATIYLGAREIRNVLRQPAAFIPSMVIPLFFYFVQSASLAPSVESGGGVSNYNAFVLPVSILFAMSNEGAGMNMVTDIERGYFDKLLVSPASRASLLVGAMGANIVRVLFTGAVITTVALATGLPFETGILGAALMILLAGLWGMAYAAIGMGVAIKTGSAQATQASIFMVFPLLFLTTSFAPREAMTGWLKTAVAFNPITYLLEGLRSFSLRGYDASDIGTAVIAIGGVGVLTMGFAFRAMGSRAR